MTTLIATAGTTSSDLINALSTGMDTAKGDLFSVLAVVIPVILGLVGIIAAVRFGIRFFKGAAQGKAN